MATRSCLPAVLVLVCFFSSCSAMGDSDTSESHKKVVIHVPSYEKVIKHTHTVYKIIGGGKGKEDNDHKHHGEVIHKHIHGGHVDHVHKHDGHGQHDHKHHGHAEHGHTHHGHTDHKHAHALHGVHDHKHSGHADHGHKHSGTAQHGHSHNGNFQGSHKHSGHSDHDHKHYGHHDHKHGHHVHNGHGGNDRAFQSLAPLQHPGYETYEYLEDLPPKGLQAYYTAAAANLNDPRGYARIGRAAAQNPANIAHLGLAQADPHDVQALFSDLYPQTFRFRKNPFPYNSELYARYFRNNEPIVVKK